MKLDYIDLKILIELEREGRITNQTLSDRVGLSPSPCMHRVRRLEKAGLIKGYRAEVEWSRIYDQVTVMAVVTLKNHGWTYLQEFERVIARIPEVTRCFSLCGEYDYLLQFTSASIRTYQAMIDTLLDGPAGIEKLISYVVMREIKVPGGLPVDDRRLRQGVETDLRDDS